MIKLGCDAYGTLFANVLMKICVLREAQSDIVLFFCKKLKRRNVGMDQFEENSNW